MQKFTSKYDGPSWKFRRRLFFTVTVISFAGIFGMLLGTFNPPDATAETAMWGFFLMIGTVLGAYTAGATWEDINLYPKNMPKRKSRPSTDGRDDDDGYYEV